MYKCAQIRTFIGLRILVRIPLVYYKDSLPESESLRTISQESLLRSSLSSLAPQASEGDVPGGTDGRGYYREAEHQSFADAGPSTDMRIELPEGDIALLDCSLH